MRTPTGTVEYVVCGWPEDGPTLRLDYRRFSYAGKFVMSSTGKAVVHETDAAASAGESEFDESVVAAVAFNEDRTDPATLWFRYITVRNDHRGEGIGARLAAFAAERAAVRSYERLRIAVNNPFAYEALHKAGFGYTGRETGIAELVLERPADRPAERSRATYQAGLDVYRERDLSDSEETFLAARDEVDPPPVIDSPRGVDA